MPVQEFALDTVGNNVQVFLSNESDNVTVLLNHSIIAVIPNREELMAAREFELPDGSTLRVQLVGTQLQVSRDGQRLLQVPYGHAAPPQEPYGASSYQRSGYSNGTPVVQIDYPTLREDIRQLPGQYMKVLTRPSAATFLVEKDKANWDIVWIQLLGPIMIGLASRLLVIFFTTHTLTLQTISYQSLLFLSGPLLFFLFVGIQYAVARGFSAEKQGTFLAQCYTTQLFAVPLGIALDLFSLIPAIAVISSFLSGAVGIYNIVLNTFAIKAVHNIGGGKALLATLAPLGLLLVFACCIAAFITTVHVH